MKEIKSFTLIEALISLFVFSLLILVLFSSFLLIYRTRTYQWEQSLAISEARRGIEKMVKEIREAREGENGAYPIEYAGDKEFIFYSDIDNDQRVERVRYFLGEIFAKTETLECQSSQRGGSCSVTFSNFLKGGNLIEAKLSVSAQGDLGASTEYLEIFADGQKIGTICASGCTDCSATFQGNQVFDVKDLAKDNFLSLIAQASDKVDPSCPYSFKVKFELSITEEVLTSTLKKGVIKPEGDPPTYPKEKETISIVSEFVRNSPPIFEYFDQDGNKIESLPARLTQTKLMKIFLVVNVNPQRPPTEYQLETFVQLRNLKEE